MFSSVFEYFSPTSKHSSEMEQKAKMGESVGNSAGAYWKHSQVIGNEKANVEIDRTSSSIQLEGRVGRRTKELEKQHRPESNWFQPEVGEQLNYQSRMVWDVTKGEEQMEPTPDHQMVWDLTSNCYHELPVQQASPYLPAYHQLYPCPPEELEDSLALAPTALPLVNLFGGVFMEFVDTLYTSTLVQYVCERTAPSEHRMAAEVLARSNLNPNAKEFNPSQDLDLSNQELEKDSQEDASLKEELKEKESSANEPEGDVKSSCQIGVHTVPLEAPCDNSACDIAFEGCGEKKEERGKGEEEQEEEEEEEEEEEDEGRELEEGHCEETALVNEDVKDSNKEEYEESGEADDGRIGEADADVDEESDDWWDSDEEPCTPSQEIDPSEFEDLFSCPLSLSSLHPTKQTTPSGSTTSSSSSPIGNSSPPPPSSSPSSFTSVATISLAAASPTKADTKLEIVNRAFNEKYSTGTAAKSKPAKVHFSEEATWQVIEEPEELADDLCEARCSDLEQRRADRERQERLLGPVLTPVHRSLTDWEHGTPLKITEPDFKIFFKFG